jgi:acyl carrier protein
VSLEDRIIGIIAEQALLEPKDVSMDATLDDLGVDSMALVEAVFAMEEAFDIDIPFNANEPQASDFDISSVRTIVDGVARLVAEKTG